jgi:hypothetical protein
MTVTPVYKVVFTPAGWQVVNTREIEDPVQFGVGFDDYRLAKECAGELNASIETPTIVPPAGTGQTSTDVATSPPLSAEHTDDAGAESQQAAAVDSSPAAAAPGSLVALVDELYLEGDTLGLHMMATALYATERALERKPAELKAVKA